MDTIEQMKTPAYLAGYVESRIGGRRENQDSYGYAQTKLGFIVSVCDGMGGGPGGKTASTIAVREIIFSLKDASADDTPENALIKAVRCANLAILAKGKEQPELRGMGSTATVAIFSKECVTVAHVGDSRIYQLRGRQKVFRTFDHSMVFDLVKQKVLNEEQARLSAQSNIITRALGMKEDVEVETHILSYDAGDRFLLCSDGIHGSMPEPELIKLASDTHHPLGVVADNIATCVDELGRTSGGGHDNLTIALLETKINSKLRPKMTSKAKLIIGLLGLLLAVSAAFNIVQGCSRDKASDAKHQEGETLCLTAASDSIALKSLRDSVSILKTINEQKSDSLRQSQQTMEKNKKEIKLLREENERYRKQSKKK